MKYIHATIYSVLSGISSLGIGHDPLHVAIGGGNLRVHISGLSSNRGYALTLFNSLTHHVTLTGPSHDGPLRKRNVMLVSRVRLRVRPS